MSDQGRYEGPPPRVVEGWVSLRDVLADAQRRLAAAGVPSPQADATALAAHVLGVPRTRLILQDRIPPETRTEYERLLSRRMARVPLQHLVGTAGFRRLELAVGPGVFIPRPETELVAGAAINALLALPEQDRIAVDLCAGSGAIALSMATEASGTRVSAVEMDPRAAEWMRKNVRRLDAHMRDAGSSVRVVESDAATCAQDGGPLSSLRGAVAVVAINPPYIPEDAEPRDPEVRDHDPRAALYGGPDGLSVVRRVLPAAAALLRPGGLLVVEHADTQGEAAGEAGVPALVRESPDWRGVEDHLDLARRPRFVTATRVAVGSAEPPRLPTWTAGSAEAAG